MFVTAIILLAVWILAEVVFWDWKRSVAYPPSPLSVKFVTGAFEVLAVALAVLVLR